MLVVALLTLGFFLNSIGLGMSNVYVPSLLQAAFVTADGASVVAATAMIRKNGAQ